MGVILFVSQKKTFLEDLFVASVIHAGSGKAYWFCEYSDIDKYIDEHHPDTMVLSYDALRMKSKWDEYKEIEIVTHACDKNELEKCRQYPFPTIGITSDTESTLRALDEKNWRPNTTDQGTQVSHEQKKEEIGQGKNVNVKEDHSQESDRKKEINAKKEEDAIQNNASENSRSDEDTLGLDDYLSGNSKETGKIESDMHDSDPDDDFEDPYDFSFTEKTDNENGVIDDNSSVRSDMYGKDSWTDRETDETDAEIDREAHPNKFSKTKVVSVCSAKGGVGKTTIATELAVYLSHVTLGSRYLRVCLIDCNIDFGDVRLTLKLSSKGPNMSTWSEEIKERQREGKNTTYTKNEIEERLRRYDKDYGLWVLPAPLTNEDSMDIESEELEIIIDNIINNGEFDYVICDTGNNTRDSVMIPLERSDSILMIMTQNRNTANCDKSFLSTMESIDFDTSNVKLIMNCLMNEKKTRISEDDIAGHFNKLECVGKIRFNSDVIRSTNEGRPLSLDPDHPFTKELRQVVAYLTGINDDIVPEEKPRFFKRLLKSHKKQR